MEEDFDEEAAMMHYGAVKIQSIARMIIIRSRILKQLNERYEKIYDPRRERYYYYDKVLDKSSWGKPLLLLKSDIIKISPTYVEGEQDAAAASAVETESVTTLGSDQLTKDTATEEEDSEEDSEKEAEDEAEGDDSEPNESDFDSDDSEAVRERRRQRRKYPRSKAQTRVDAAEDDIHNTTSLDLSGLGATRVTSRIYDMVELRDLNLSNNKLARISPNIQYFQQLEKLDVHNNRLPTLPKEMEELLELTYLDVSHNEITTYTGRVYKLSKLEHFNLSHNPLKVIPTEVGNLELLAELGQWEIGINFLSRLRYLDVSYCQLTAWPVQLGQLLELETLLITHNAITEIPADIADLQSLRVLQLEGNGITKLAPEIYNLPRLEVLNLSHNNIAALPEPPPSNLATDPVDRCMEKLVSLDLSYNELTVLDDLLGIFSKVTTFTAAHNQIQCFLGETISKLTELTLFDMSYNQLEYFPLGLKCCTKLTHLTACYNKLGFVPETLVHTTKLIRIDLSHNEITDAAGKVFAMLSHLRVLLLNHNRIGPLPAMLYTVRQLEHLDLSYNEIPIIAEALGHLKSVTYLNLSYNRITSLPDTISELTQLHTLELEGNRLTSLPAGLGKLYRKLNRITVHKNDFSASPQLLQLLPLLLSCNLSWNPRLQGQWVDWTQFSAEYKPKKTFIPPQVLQRRIHQAVERLDQLIISAPPPPTPESHFRTAEEGKAARAAAEESELTDFQNNIADDDPDVAAAGAASVKAARKARAKNAKRLKQALDWHAALREYLQKYAFRAESTALPDGRQRSYSEAVALLNDPNISTADKIKSAKLPGVEDLRHAQHSRLNAHLYSLFKATDRLRGGCGIGLSWQEALSVASNDVLSDRKCANLLCEISIGGEFQDSVEALQYLLNECDVLFMVTELSHMMQCHAKRVHQLRLELKEDEAVQSIAPGIKARLSVLSTAARKSVHDRHATGEGPVLMDLRGAGGGAAAVTMSAVQEEGEDGSEDGDHEEKNQRAVSLSGRESPSARASPVMDILGGLAGLSRKRGASADLTAVPEADGSGSAKDTGDGAEASNDAGAESAAAVAEDTIGFEDDRNGDQAGADTPSRRGGSGVNVGSKSTKSGKSRKEMSRKEIAVENVDVLARNVKVAAKVKRADNTLAEETAKLQKLIADTMAQLQKPQLGVDYAALPLLAFSAVAVEGTFPGIPATPAANQEPLLAHMVDLCLHLMKVLLLRCDALRDAIRTLELRASVKISCLDIAQRRGTDLIDLMEDVYEELSRKIEAKENESGGKGGGKSKSIFKRQGTNSAAVLAAAMSDPSHTASNSDGEDVGEGGDYGGEGDGDGGTATPRAAATGSTSAAGTPTHAGALTRSNTGLSSATSPKAKSAVKQARLVTPLSTLLPPIDKTREVIAPVDPSIARKCISHLYAHRVLTYMWVNYLAEVAAGVLKRRGVDPIYPLFRGHTKHEYNSVPEWATRSAGRLAQFRGAVCQGLGLYARAAEEYSACSKFSASAKSLPYYVNLIKLNLAQGNFLLARNALYDCLRLHYPKNFPEFDLADDTAMPEPLDILPVNKELAMLQALVDCNLRYLNAAGVFTAPLSKFLCVQDNGLMSASNRIPVEVQRGHTPHKVAAIKARLAGNAAALGAAAERAALEESRGELKNRIAEAQLKYTTALAEAP